MLGMAEKQPRDGWGRIIRDAHDRGTHSLAHTLRPSSFYYVYTHSNISDTYRLAVSTSGAPSKECPDIPDKLTLRLTFGTPPFVRMSALSVFFLI